MRWLAWIAWFDWVRISALRSVVPRCVMFVSCFCSRSAAETTAWPAWRAAWALRSFSRSNPESRVLEDLGFSVQHLLDRFQLGSEPIHESGVSPHPFGLFLELLLDVQQLSDLVVVVGQQSWVLASHLERSAYSPDPRNHGVQAFGEVVGDPIRLPEPLFGGVADVAYLFFGPVPGIEDIAQIPDDSFWNPPTWPWRNLSAASSMILKLPPTLLAASPTAPMSSSGPGHSRSYSAGGAGEIHRPSEVELEAFETLKQGPTNPTHFGGHTRGVNDEADTNVEIGGLFQPRQEHYSGSAFNAATWACMSFNASSA